MYNIYPCECNPLGACPFPYANCNTCVPETVYEEDDLINLKDEEDE